jgi:predicted phosphate transport protein (TIGR00153 family)
MSSPVYTRKADSMFKFLFKKEQLVETLIYAYLDIFKEIQNSFLKSLQACLLNGATCENFDFHIRQTHKFESRADDIKDEINDLMYGKALIPDARGDVMEIMASFDMIPRLFEEILYLLQTQKLIVPEFLLNDLRELVRISLECCDLVVRQAKLFFKKDEGFRVVLNTIDENESHCDHIERRMLTKLFDSDADPFQKLQIKELIIELGKISDRADRLSKLINIVRMKRRV